MVGATKRSRKANTICPLLVSTAKTGQEALAIPKVFARMWRKLLITTRFFGYADRPELLSAVWGRTHYEPTSETERTLGRARAKARPVVPVLRRWEDSGQLW